MAQFDLYKNSGKNSEIFPYLLDITNDMHKDLSPTNILFSIFNKMVLL